MDFLSGQQRFNNCRICLGVLPAGQLNLESAAQEHWTDNVWVASLDTKDVCELEVGFKLRISIKSYESGNKRRLVHVSRKDLT